MSKGKMNGNVTDQTSVSFWGERTSAEPDPALSAGSQAGSLPKSSASGGRTSDNWTVGLAATKQMIPWALKGIPELASPLAD